MSVISADSVANEDLLGRKKFAKQIVNSLTKAFSAHNESFVVGINGPWGSGKSTLLSFLEKELNDFYQDDIEKYKIIHFNPWANNTIDHEELERNFLEVLIKELQSIHWRKNIEEKNDKFRSYLKYLNYLKFVKHVHPVAEKIVDAVEDYTNQSSVHSIIEVKTQADNLIEEKGIKLFILLDDLDRLNHQEIATIFKVIKLNVNFFNTCFIIAYDKAVVTEALNDSFNQKGEAYLEKIIQVDFTVPEITDESMESVFTSEINQLMASLQLPFKEDDIIKVWKFYGLKEYFRTLRDVKRYMNSLLFSLPNIVNEINLIDFLVLEAIKVFDYSAYQKIYNDFLIIQRKAIWQSSSFDQTTINEYLNVTTKSLLEYLFIKKGSITQLMRGSLNSKNLYDPEYFKRYYTLYISSKDVSQDTLTQFLSIGLNREQILRDAIQAGKIKSLLKRLSDSDLQKFYTVADTYILETFLKFWDHNGNEITNELDEYLWHCYFNVAHSITNKFEAAKAAIENLALKENETQPMRFVFNYFIILFDEDKRRDRELRELVKDQVDIALPQLRKAFERHIEKQWPSYFWNAVRGDWPFVGRLFIYATAKYVPNEHKKALDEYLQTPKFSSFLLKIYFLRIDEDKKPSSIDLSKKDILLPEGYWNHFVAFLQNAKKGTWDQHTQECVNFFLNSLSGNT
ncbi:MAG: KAP family P-loop NTPase fold protein [Flavisolibacter sp.]